MPLGYPLLQAQNGCCFPPVSHPAQVHTVAFHSSHIPTVLPKVSSGSLPAPSRFNWNALKANLVVCRR